MTRLVTRHSDILLWSATGHEVGIVDRNRCAGPYTTTLDDLPTDEQIDRELARAAAEREQRWPLSRLERVGF